MDADPRVSLIHAVKGSRREQLEAYRDYLADQLEGSKCQKCLQSELRAGEQTSLIKLLKDVTAELDSIKASESKTSRLSGIRSIAQLDDARERRNATGDRRKPA